MECFQESNSLNTNPPLGFQSSMYVSDADPDAKLPDQTPELRKEDTHKLYLRDAEDAQTTADSLTEVVVEKVQEELEKQLRLNEEIDDRDSVNWNQDEDFKSGYSNGREEEYNMDDKEDNDDDDDDERLDDDDEERKDERSNGNRRHQYPVRPEAEDCSYYMKTGTCKFGSNCKFNHPVRRKNQVTKEKVKEREDQTERPGQTECKYYLRTGGCKYGKACRYNHSRARPLGLQAKPAVFPALDLNFLGLPIRPGEKECPYYMRNGSCKYGANCRFNHPDPTAVGGSDAPSAFSNGSASLQKSSQPSVASWSTPRGLNETAPFVPIMFPPTQAVPPQSPEWTGYQAPVYPPERSIHPPPAYVMTPAVDANAYSQQQQMPVDEFPERPGQPECSYYMKTGDCKFKSNCKYHHPKNQMSKSPPCELSDKGLPLRPGQSICSYYKRYGICKFGPSCKFDHSIQPASTMGSTDDQGTPYGDSMAKEEVRMIEPGNGTD